MLRPFLYLCLPLYLLGSLPLTAQDPSADGNRLVYLAEPGNPFYVDGTFPRLITPQWIGDPDVQGVVVLSIDDMREPEGYEAFLRPILERLKQIDGRAPVSILTNTIHTDHPQLQIWLEEGLSLEVHTVDHPCPCLQNGNFNAARSTYERCVDLLHEVPGNRPVAYRMPCCDSINSTSPRFWAEIFNRRTGEGNFLQIDSSVFLRFTPDDSNLPPAVATRPDGESRFGHYLPFPSFVNTIDNYPYPYVIGHHCWQVPCLVPSDWEGQHVNQANSPRTLADMKVAVDATILKQGATSLVFHPHGWISNEQLVDLIDHAVAEHGDSIRFLNFAEYLHCLTHNLLAGQSIRSTDGHDNGVRLLDLNNDGFQDVVIGNREMMRTRLWEPTAGTWQDSPFPIPLVHVDAEGNHQTTGAQFFVVRPDGQASLWVHNEQEVGVWHFDQGEWTEDPLMLRGLELDGQPIFSSRGGIDQGVRFRDLDNDGYCELICGGNDPQIFRWNFEHQRWELLPFQLPPTTRLVTRQGKDAGLRFVDVNRDGFDDALFSNEARYSLHLFQSMTEGWSRLVQQGVRPAANEIPPIVVNGANNGAWIARDHLWVQNEATSGMPDLVDRRSFTELLGDDALQPQSAEASLRAIEVAPEFRVELVASEPLVQDPVAFDWGPDGRLWVVEMADYPLGLDDRGKPGGRVRVLEDTNGDGKYDQGTLFADQLPFPTDIMVWRGGVLVTAAPDVLFLVDEDQDGRADRQEAWFSGFGEGNQQHRVNGLKWGLDNRVYLANGDSGGKIRSAKTGQTVNIAGRDLRLEPDTGFLQALTGQTQHGRCRDDWGNWWGANNSTPMIQFVLDDHYLARNPFVEPPDPRFVYREGDWGLYPVSRIISHYSGYESPAAGQPGQFTSACGTTVYRDTLLGNELSGNLFVSEPVHNLIHRRQVETNGPLMRPVKPPDEAGREFLRSRDSWFRPTTLRTGPDGALWVADMYRLVIEHPEWIDDRVEETLDLRQGHNMGRIYRILPSDRPTRTIVDLTRETNAQLIERLADSSGTLRDMVHRQLLWRQGHDIVPLLQKTFEHSQNPHQRLSALCTLAGRNATTIDLLLQAMRDGHPALRRHGVRIAEQWIKNNRLEAAVERQSLRTQEVSGPDTPATLLLKEMAQLTRSETDPQVLKQLAYSLGEVKTSLAGRLMGQMLVQYRGDPYLTAATISGLPGHLGDVWTGLLEHRGETPLAELPVEALLSTALGQQQTGIATAILKEILRDDGQPLEVDQLDLLAAISLRVQNAGQSMDGLLSAGNSAQALQSIRQKARQLLVDSKVAQPIRHAAIRFLVSDPDFLQQDTESILSLLTPQTPSDIQQLILEALSRIDSAQTLRKVLLGWDRYGPLTRDRIIGQFLQTDQAKRQLLNAIAEQSISPSDINLAYTQSLIHDRDPQIARQASQLLDRGVNPERQAVIDRYLPIVRRGGDEAQGRIHFEATCSACHQLGDTGYPVGPNLAALNDLSPEFLTTHILDSPRAIEDKYRNYIVLTQDGRQFSGLLQSETSTSLTLLGQQGKTDTILKRDLEEGGFRRSQVSMMPQGLETSLEPEALADLVAYILQYRQPSKSFKGNQPRVVRPNAGDGSLRLTAASAKIFGPSLIFEEQYGNLGFWGSIEDRAEWSIDIAEEGQYDLYLDWAVPEGAAGNAFRLQAGSSVLKGIVESTGSWDRYHQAKIGTMNLPAGPNRIICRSDQDLRGFLMDLRSICLVPTGNLPPKEFEEADLHSGSKEN